MGDAQPMQHPRAHGTTMWWHDGAFVSFFCSFGTRRGLSITHFRVDEGMDCYFANEVHRQLWQMLHCKSTDFPRVFAKLQITVASDHSQPKPSYPFAKQ
jgi:hypothetical protein